MAGLQPIYERWRPMAFAEVVGQDRAVKRLGVMQENSGLEGRAYWLAGPSGTGKTTLARLIAADVADEINVQEIDATGLSAAAIQEIERASRCYGMGAKPGRAYIVNEAHGVADVEFRNV